MTGWMGRVGGRMGEWMDNGQIDGVGRYIDRWRRGWAGE